MIESERAWRAVGRARRRVHGRDADGLIARKMRALAGGIFRPSDDQLDEVHGSVAVPARPGSAAAAAAAVRVSGAGVPGERRLHGPGQLGDRPGGGRTVRLCADLGPVDVEPDGRAPADAGGAAGGGDGARPGPGLPRRVFARVNVVLWVLAEIAIAACDLAEVLGTIIAFKLLFGLPLLWGCLVTAFDTFLLLSLQRWGMRKMEAVILALVATIGGCFLLQIFLARPELAGVVSGLAAELAARLVVRRDRHPGRDRDAAQPLPALGAGADAADRQASREQGDGLPLQLDRHGHGAQCRVLRQRGDPGPERGGVPPPWRGGRPASRRRTGSCPRSSGRARRSCSGSPCCARGRARP